MSRPVRGAWLARVELALADRLLGEDSVTRALLEERTYASAPRLDASGRVTAVLSREAWQDGRFAGREPRTTTTVRLRDEDALELACTCARGGRFLCEHATAVLVDLAVSEPLRAGVGAGEDVTEATRALPALRRLAHEERTLDERLAQWLPPRLEDDLELELDVVRVASAATPDARPAVLLRARRPSSRAYVPPKELLASRLPSRSRRLLELTVPSAHHRDALVATRAQASLLVELAREDGEVLARATRARVRFAPGSVRPRVDVLGERLVARWETEDGALVVDAADALLFSGPFPFVWSEPHAVFHRVAPDVDLDVAWGLSVVPSLPLGPTSRGRVGQALLGRGRGTGVAMPPPEAFGLPPLEAPSFELSLEGTPLAVEARLSAVYAGGRFAVSVRPPAEVADGRDDEAEAAAIAVLARAGLVADGDGRPGVLRADEEHAVAFWQEGIALVRATTEPPIVVRLAEDLARVRVGPAIDVHVSVSVASGWLDTQLEFTVAALKVEMRTVAAALASNRRWVALTDGTLSRINDDVAALVDDARRASPLLHAEGRAPLAAAHLGRVARWLERFGADADAPAGRGGRPSLDDVRERLATALGRCAEPALPRRLKATLRPYQRDGLAWLQFLRAIGAGGVLADDMGLGKTLTTLAHLARWKEDEGGAPSLVVCPTSLVGNWAAEAARFTPSLRVLVVHGEGRRERLLRIDEHDLVLTTYGLLRRDVDALARTRFRAVVLDEAQHVKNRRSATAKAARRLTAAARLALSGTPVENRLAELYALMGFANPGILGPPDVFEARYERPISEQRDARAAADLRALIRPFILRRTKAEVLAELPPKTEVTRHVLLRASHRRLYDALATELKRAVREDESRGPGARRMSVLTAILRLRQMACDARLVEPTFPAEQVAKREAFLEIVREVAASGRRALVFSQFVQLLALLRADLEREGIAYEYLDGTSTQRDAIVARFQDGSAPLFLVSLKAGGAGLNLTGADTVIHCDPWWNPAATDQATDRAHRIGQSRAVTVVKLVARGTIEEKLGLLEAHKRALASAVLAADGADVVGRVGALTEDELLRLLGEDGPPGPDEPSRDVPHDGEVAEAPARLTARELDELREIVRWLERSGGVPRTELARRAGVRPTTLSLLLIGHRVPVAPDAARRIRAIYDARRTGGVERA